MQQWLCATTFFLLVNQFWVWVISILSKKKQETKMLFLLTSLVTLVVGSAANGAVQDASAFSYVVAVAIANNEGDNYIYILVYYKLLHLVLIFSFRPRLLHHPFLSIPFRSVPFLSLNGLAHCSIGLHCEKCHGPCSLFAICKRRRAVCCWRLALLRKCDLNPLCSSLL